MNRGGRPVLPSGLQSQETVAGHLKSQSWCVVLLLTGPMVASWKLGPGLVKLQLGGSFQVVVLVVGYRAVGATNLRRR